MSAKHDICYPHHHLKIKWDDEENLYYYRLEGSSFEHDDSVPQFEELGVAVASGFFTLKKGNGGFDNMMKGKKVNWIIYDLYRLKRDDEGIVIFPVVSVEVLEDSKELIGTQVKSQVLQTEKEIISLDTESGDSQTVNGFISQVGLINESGCVVADFQYERNEFLVEDNKNKIAALCANKMVVGHTIQTDFDRMEITHEDIYDIGQRFLDVEGRKFRLKDLVCFFYGQKIQTGKHNAIEDAYYSVRLLEIFPGLPVVVYSRDFLKGVCEQGGGEAGVDKYLRHLAYLKKKNEEEFLEFQRLSEERFSLESSFHKITQAWAVPVKIEYSDLGFRLNKYVSWNPKNKKFPVYILQDTDQALYEFTFDKERGWSFVYLDEEFLDVKNSLGIRYSRFILSKNIPLDAKKKYDQKILNNMKVYFSIVNEKGWYFKHNLIKITCAEFLWDYYGDDLRKYERWVLDKGKKLVLWGTIGEWMMLVDVT